MEASLSETLWTMTRKGLVRVQSWMQELLKNLFTLRSKLKPPNQSGTSKHKQDEVKNEFSLSGLQQVY